MQTIETMIFEWCFFIFTSFVCGFAQGTISFTATPVIVPLLLGILKFNLMSSLFISVMIDLANTMVLSCIYGYHKKIIFFSGVCFGLLQMPMEIIIPILMRGFLLKYSRIFFLIRGTIKFIKSKISKKKNEKIVDESEYSDEERVNNDENSEDIDNIFLSIFKKIKHFIGEEMKENHEYPEVEKPKTNGFYENLIYKIRGKSGEDIIFLENLPFKAIRLLIFTLAIFINSFTDGLLYKGGGFAINLGIHFLFRQKHSVSTGTACFISMFGLSGLAISFIGRAELLKYTIISRLIVGLIFSSFGAICGANWVLYFSDIFVYLMIGFTMFLIGSISIIQAVF
eukprot:gene9168-1256_t